MVKLERQLKAVANRRRLAILAFLKKNKFASVGEIADAIKLSFKATSKHLLILANMEILEKDQENLQMFYRVSKSQASSVVRHLISIL